jgi:hypothetical protein
MLEISYVADSLHLEFQATAEGTSLTIDEWNESEWYPEGAYRGTRASVPTCVAPVRIGALSVPEPPTFALLGLCIAGLGFWRRTKEATASRSESGAFMREINSSHAAWRLLDRVPFLRGQVLCQSSRLVPLTIGSSD